MSPEEIVEAFIQIEAYAGAARAFDSYDIATQVFGEFAQREQPGASQADGTDKR